MNQEMINYLIQIGGEVQKISEKVYQVTYRQLWITNITNGVFFIIGFAFLYFASRWIVETDDYGHESDKLALKIVIGIVGLILALTFPCYINAWLTLLFNPDALVFKSLLQLVK